MQALKRDKERERERERERESEWVRARERKRERERARNGFHKQRESFPSTRENENPSSVLLVCNSFFFWRPAQFFILVITKRTKKMICERGEMVKKYAKVKVTKCVEDEYCVTVGIINVPSLALAHAQSRLLPFFGHEKSITRNRRGLSKVFQDKVPKMLRFLCSFSLRFCKDIE